MKTENDSMRLAICVVALCGLFTSAACADVLNLGGTRNADGTWTGLASLETVPVGNPGNAPDTRYDAAGYGSVAYSFNIGKYEVTAGQYTAFLNAVAATDPYGLYNTDMYLDDTPGYNEGGCKIQRSGTSGHYTYSVAADWANRPVNYVSWGDAARFANWLHNGQPVGEPGSGTTEDGAYTLNGAVTTVEFLTVTRNSDWKWAISTEDEWYKAAYYNPLSESYYDYPTGSNITPSNELLNPDPGNNATFYAGGYTLGSPYNRTEVGEHENSCSPYGTFDQGGNVWEYNEALCLGDRGARGGSFNHYDGHMLALYREDNNPAFGENRNYGFRVSAIPEPGTLGMMVMGLAALIRRRG